MSAHAVEDGRLLYCSASQLNSFTRCERLWWYEKVARVPPPPNQNTDALDRGTRMHEQLERWYEHGTTPEHGSLRTLITHPRWPKPSKQLLIEHPRSFKLGIKAAGVELKGRGDLIDPSDLTCIGIYDLKSMATFRFALSAEALSHDLQLTIYGKFAFSIYPQAREVFYAHGQALSKGEDARVVVSDPLPPQHVNAVFESIESLVERMKITAQAKHPEDVRGDETGEACEKFRGCNFKSICPRFAHDDFFSETDFTHPPLPGETTVSDTIAEKLAARVRAASPALGVNPPDAAKPAPVVPWNPPETTPTLLAKEPVVVSSTPPPEPLVAASRMDATAPATTGLFLWINCRPDVGEGTRLEDLIAAYSAPLLTKHKVKDLRQAAYGQGVADLCVSFKERPPTGHVFATSGGVSSTVIETLVPFAQVVARGF